MRTIAFKKLRFNDHPYDIYSSDKPDGENLTGSYVPLSVAKDLQAENAHLKERLRIAAENAAELEIEIFGEPMAAVIERL